MSESLELHELCQLFPPMDADELEGLRKDIQTNGLRAPIVLFEGKILDGQNRYRACTDIGVPIRTMPYKGDDPAAYVVSVNNHRRHNLNTGQRAIIVALATDWAAAHRHGGDRESEKYEQVATLPPGLQSIAARAEQSGTSARTQGDADRLVKADPELAKEVAQGKITLGRAKKQVTPLAEPKKKTPAQLKAEAKAAAKAKESAAAQQLAQDAGFLDPIGIAELERVQKENDELRRQIEALTKDDQAAELQKHMQIAEHAVREKSAEMDKAAQFKRMCDQLQRFQTKVLRITGTKTPDESLAWITAHA
jgi:ParB-like chromosome segregation protein Spo0J